MSSTPQIDALVDNHRKEKWFDYDELLELAKDIEATLRRERGEAEELQARCCPEDVGPEEWIATLKKRDNVQAWGHLQELVSLLLGTRVAIGPMRDRADYPVELQRAIDFLHNRMPKPLNEMMVPLLSVVGEPCMGCGKRPCDFISGTDQASHAPYSREDK